MDALLRLLPIAALTQMVGCYTSEMVRLDHAFVGRPASQPCEALVEDRDERSWSASLMGGPRDSRYASYTRVVSVDETWVVRTHVERRLGLKSTHLPKHRSREHRFVLRCDGHEQRLEVRECRVRGRTYAVVDGRSIDATRSGLCRLEVEVRTGRRWVMGSQAVELRPSLSRIVEEG